MAQLLVNMPYKVFMLLWTRHYHIHPSFHTCRRESPSHNNLLALCMTPSHSLGVNRITTSPICIYVITSASLDMSRGPSPFNSMFTSWESLVLMLIWNTTPKHCNISKNWPKRNHFICDYMRLLVICNYIWTFLQLFWCSSFHVNNI